MIPTKTILVVEDDLDLCKAMERTLQAERYKTVGTNTFREAMIKLKNQNFSCVLLDLRLGEEKGEDLIEFMRSRPDVLSKDSPVVLISGHLEADIVSELKDKIKGALVKPFDMKSLVSAVKKAAL